MAKQFMKKRNHRKALLVDGLNLAFRWKHKGQKDFADDYISTVKSLATSYGCAKIIVLSDKGSSVWRKEKFPEYKGNRAELRAKQTEAEASAFQDFIQEYERTLMLMESLEDWPVLRYQGIEADDLAAYIVVHKEELGIEEISLISTDADWDLLLREGVMRFSYINRKETSLETWSQFHDTAHEFFITEKCLAGDKGDNVPGIAGIGPKRAADLINIYGDVFDIYNSIPIQGKAKYLIELNANAEQLLLNVELMDLPTYCDEIVGEENIADLTPKVMRYLQL